MVQEDLLNRPTTFEGVLAHLAFALDLSLLVTI